MGCGGGGTIPPHHGRRPKLGRHSIQSRPDRIRTGTRAQGRAGSGSAAGTRVIRVSLPIRTVLLASIPLAHHICPMCGKWSDKRLTRTRRQGRPSSLAGTIAIDCGSISQVGIGLRLSGGADGGSIGRRPGGGGGGDQTGTAAAATVRRAGRDGKHRGRERDQGGPRARRGAQARRGGARDPRRSRARRRGRARAAGQGRAEAREAVPGQAEAEVDSNKRGAVQMQFFAGVNCYRASVYLM